MTTTNLGTEGCDVDPGVERFDAAGNAALDAGLARHDLWGSLAHARMLRRAGLLELDEWQALDAALRALLALAEGGELRPSPADEDIHTTIENALVAQIGAPGKKLHLGRSRNDQVQLPEIRRAHGWTP